MVNNFSIYKSLGADRIIPVMLQNQLNRIIPCLMEIYQSCIELRCVLHTWRCAKIVFTLETGKLYTNQFYLFIPSVYQRSVVFLVSEVVFTAIGEILEAQLKKMSQ